MNLINWPVPDERYRDLGEGGLFAYLIIADFLDGPAEVTTHCNVDTYAHLDLPDVCVSPEGIRLWPSGAQREEEYRNASDVHHFLGQHGAPDRLKEWPLATRSVSWMSESLWATVFLGSTSAALCDEDGYFAAAYEHLTEPGRVLHDTMRHAYGIEPRLLTFLDT